MAAAPNLDPWPPDDPGDRLYEMTEQEWLTDGARLPEPAAGVSRPPVREVIKAGFWDRSSGDGAGFAAGGVADDLPPGPVLAGLAGDLWDAGLDRLSDDELIGVLRAARRLGSWAAAMELAAVDDLWRRRVAEEAAGDKGVAEHADDEIAAALTLTSRAASQVLDLAIGLARLPLTRAALAAGDIDMPRAKVIVQEFTGLTDEHVAAVERAIIGAAPGQTTGQLCQATRRAVIAADPGAARRRKEQALREGRVERFTEHAGTAALAGRDLPPLSVLAADQNLTAQAERLMAAGVPGTLDILRSKVFLALLNGTPPSALLPTASDGQPGEGQAGNGVPSDGLAGASGCADVPMGPGGDQPPGRPSNRLSRASVNLTVPLATWLGPSQAPGHADGFGYLDASDSRDLASALAAQPGTKWCITLTGQDGRPVGHGCARTGPPGTGPPPTWRISLTGPDGHPAAPGSARTGPAGAAPRSQRAAGQRAGPGDGTWNFTVTWLDCDECDHAHQTAAYRPGRTLRHLVHIRKPTCSYPGCRRPARQCDDDHTIPFHLGGKTCLCNLAPLCRWHHQAKQAHGWTLHQTAAGTMTWTTPSGRSYAVTPTPYPAG